MKKIKIHNSELIMKIDFQKIKYKKEIINFVEKISKDFPEAEVFLVGGTVRDILLKQTDQMDYDFLIRKVEAKKLEKFLNKLGKVNLVGKQFGVFKFLPNTLIKTQKDSWDIALPRTEYSGNSGARADFNIQSDPNLSIQDDLSRRDFTINSMALLLQATSYKLQAKLIDPFNGQDDLKKKIIKTAGNPEQRFKEDYSRMLRGIRFACQFNFKIEKKTWRALKKLMLNINNVINGERLVPYETIAKEFLKSFYCAPSLAFNLCDQSGIFKNLIPEILKMKKCPQPKKYHTEGDVWKHTKLALLNLDSKKFKKQFKKEKNSIELILATMFHDIGKPYTIKTPKKDEVDRIRFNNHDQIGAKLFKKICQRLKFSSVPNLKFETSKAVWLVVNHLLIFQEVEKMKNRTIEKYFFNEKYSGQDLLKLSFVDTLATIPKNGKIVLTSFNKIIKRIKNLKKLNKEKNRLPKPILNGHEIIKKFNLCSGRQIGKLLEILREAQLGGEVKNKKQAGEFLKKYLIKDPKITDN
ncbi:MAG: HD domain-containing protein [Patescibacteria group bacterium]